MGANFSLGEAVLGTSVDLKGLADGVKQARSDSQGFIDGFAGQLQTLGKVAAGVGAAIAAALVGGGLALAIDAAPVEGIAGAFAGTTESIGSSLEEMQAAFDEATAGMVSHRDAMLTFNQAAQLVSKDFAAGLPGAMELLGKVSAATGKDMAYLMDSLVTGIGRLSGPILDNLAIQTDATAAYEAFAEAIGKSAGDLTKQEQQMALFAQVMEKLRENTASMPDATDTTAASLARFQAAIQNLKDDIGVELLPVLQPFLDIAVDLGEDALPILKDILEDVTPFAEGFANAVKGFVKGIEGGMTPMDSFERQIKSLFPHDTVEKIMGVVEDIQEFIDRVSQALQPVAEFIANNVQLSDVLLGLGVAIATFVVPAIAGILATVGQVAGVFLLVVGAVAALRTAWETNFGGIRTALTEAWAQIQPALQQLAAALGLDAGGAVNALGAIVQGVLLPALEGIVTVVSTYIIPAITNLVVWLSTAIPNAIVFVNTAVQTLVGIWQGILLPAFQAVGGFISGTLIPFLAAMGNLFSAVVGVAVAYAAQMFNAYLLPALRAVWKFIKATFQPVLEEVGEFLSHKFTAALGKVTEFAQGVKAAFQGIVNILQTLTDLAKKAADALKSVKPDPSMTPGSPTPFEMGLRGVMRTMQEMNRYVPDFLTQSMQVEARGIVETISSGPPLAAEGGLVLHNYGQITLQGGGDEGEGGITGLIRQFKDMA